MRAIQSERVDGGPKLALGADGEVSVEEADMPFDELSTEYEPEGVVGLLPNAGGVASGAR